LFRSHPILLGNDSGQHPYFVTFFFTLKPLTSHSTLFLKEEVSPATHHKALLVRTLL